MTLGNIALLYQYTKDIEEAASVYQQALAVFIQIGDQASIAKTLGNIALIRQEQGDLEESLEYFEQALEGYRELGDRHGEVTVLVNLSRLHNQRGDTKQVKMFASQARLLSESLGFTDELDRLQTIFNLLDYTPIRLTSCSIRLISLNLCF